MGGAAWARLLVVSGVLIGAGLALISSDGAISRAVVGFQERSLGGDIRRELHALQQYGQGAVTLLVAWAIWLGDPGRRRRLLDWMAAAAVAGGAAFGLKMLIGRPRPKFDDPGHFLGPFGAYPIDERVGVRHAWEVWAGISSDLWSMPSSHTVFAAVMSVVLWTLYPRLKPLGVLMIVVVGTGRVVFGAHYVSDVLVGAGVGLLAATAAVRGCWGERAVDLLWKRFVDREAEGAGVMPGR